MRQKVIVNPIATDRELFEQLPTGDFWPEAELAQVWMYLYSNSHLRVPDSWQSTIDDFNKIVTDMVSTPVFEVDESTQSH